MTTEEALELVRKYSEEMPSRISAEILNSLADYVFVKKAIGNFSRENEIYRVIKIQAENPSEKFETEDESDKSVTNHPKRYMNKSGIEAIDVIEIFCSMTDGASAFNLGTAVKYLARLGKKTKNVQEEWKKVLWYVDRLIDMDHPVIG